MTREQQLWAALDAIMEVPGNATVANCQSIAAAALAAVSPSLHTHAERESAASCAPDGEAEALLHPSEARRCTCFEYNPTGLCCYRPGTCPREPRRALPAVPLSEDETP